MHRRLLSLGCLMLAAAFGTLLYADYWRWRDCFNDQGRCFDATTGTVQHAQSGVVWLVLCCVFFVAGAAMARRPKD